MVEKDVLKEEDVKKLFSGLDNSEKIKSESSLSWDGRNLLIRIPKDISEYLGLNEDNRFKNNFQFIIDINDDNVKKSFEIVERTKPKREINKNVKK